MEPTFAESAPHRGRFIGLFGALAASVVALAVLRPAPPAPPHDDGQYDQYKRVGKCVDGRWVLR
jgi:hypothetical protein